MIVVWRITNRCNLACSFCAYDRRLSIPRQDVDAAQVERFAPILADYQRATGDKVLLSWIGGEPLLWKPFFIISKWLHESLGIAVSTTSNGTSFHRPQVRTAILDTLSELTISVDGLAAFHNAVRSWPDGWERLKASVIALAKERNTVKPNFKLRVNVVLMHQNLTQFESLCDELVEWGINEITFNQLGGRDRPEFYIEHRLTPSDAMTLKKVVPTLQKRLALQHVRVCASPSYLERIEASAENKSLFVSDCQPGQRFLFIDENGTVSPCNFTISEFGMPIEEIRDVHDLLALPHSFSAVQKRRSCSVACEDCPSTQVFAKFAS